jgi:exodeoxyribonuclease VIII
MKKERLSYSALTQFAKSPNHLLSYWAKDFEPTPAMLFGSLLHKMILEPETFSEQYAVYEGTRRGKIWEEFKAVNNQKDIVTAKEYNHAYKTYKKATSNEIFRSLLMQVGETEKSIEWQFEGVNYRGFVDMVGDGFIADIKTTVDAGSKFERDLWYNDYSLQAVMYLKNFKPNTKYYIIAVEKGEPYNVQVYELGAELLEKAEARYKELNDLYKAWDGKPQGYSNEIKVIGSKEFIY